MSVGQNPFDEILQSLQQQGQQAPQSPAPAAPPQQFPTSPLGALPGYNDAIAQQAQNYLQNNATSGKTPRDYMLEAMGVTPDQDSGRDKKGKILHRLGIAAQVLGGRNFAQEGQTKYQTVQDTLKQAEAERSKQQQMSFEQAQLSRSLAAPYISKAADLDYQQKLAQQQLDLGKKKLETLQSMPLWESLPPQIKAQYTAESMGMKAPNLASSLMKDQQVRVSAEGLSPDVRQTYGLPEKGPVTVFRNNLDGSITGAFQGWAGNGVSWDSDGNGFLYDKSDPSKKVYIPGAKNPSFAKTTRSEWKSVQTTDENGNTVTKFFPVQVSSQKGGTGTTAPAQSNTAPAAAPMAPAQPPPQAAPPAAGTLPGGAPNVPATPYGQATASIPQPTPQASPAVPSQVSPPAAPPLGAIRKAAGSTRPSGGGMDFVKTYTPEQQVKAKQQLGNLDQSIGRIQRIQANLPALNSLIDSKKIEMQIDPKQGLIHAAINRNVPLTDKEAQLAADYQSMMEDINMLRGPLGATGFRGPEAFAALTGQAGHLMANPKVTEKVLQNTLENFNNIRNPIATQLSRRNGKASSNQDVLPGNISLADIDAELARRKAKK